MRCTKQPPNHTVSLPLTQALICHPASPYPATVSGIDTEISRETDGGLTLSYRLHGAPRDILIPPAQLSSPADGLWQHTCCELFIAPVHSPKYEEFNFAPSGQWANYRFNAYRERDHDFTASLAPRITFQTLDDGFQLDATLSPAQLPNAEAWQISLSVVLEAADGSKSYWALTHCTHQPDFHHRQSFSLTLPDTTL